MNLTKLISEIMNESNKFDSDTTPIKESSIKTINMLFKNKGMKDAIRKEKVDQIRKAIESEGISTKNVSDDEILTIAKELNEVANKRRLKESVYTNQTGLKTAMLGEPKLNRLLKASTDSWARRSDVKVFKEKRFFIFTDGKREMVITHSDGDFKVMKKLGRISKVTKRLYNELANESTDIQSVLLNPKGDKFVVSERDNTVAGNLGGFTMYILSKSGNNKVVGSLPSLKEAISHGKINGFTKKIK